MLATMPIAPELLLSTFSLAQVAAIVIAFENAHLGIDDAPACEPSANDRPTTPAAPLAA